MPNVKANGIQIEYETFGDSSSPALVLIMGLGGQMIYWDEEICKKLAKQNLYVIRFDNRDSGLSQKIVEAGVPDLMKAMEATLRGEKIKAYYTYDDMADDTIGLLDVLDIEKAHICGISMGSGITQTIGIRHPSRVLSLIPIMMGTGNPDNPRAKPEMWAPFFTPPPQERGAFSDYFVTINRMWAGTGFPFNEDWFRRKGGEAFDRGGIYLEGTARQLLAGMAHGNMKPALASVTAPTLVIHGSDDPLIHIDAGKDTAASIPGAELLIIEGMGHELPHGTGAWLKVFDAIVAHTAKAQG